MYNRKRLKDRLLFRTASGNFVGPSPALLGATDVDGVKITSLGDADIAALLALTWNAVTRLLNKFCAGI